MAAVIVSPTRKVSREAYVDALVQLSLDRGKLPAEVSIDALTKFLGVTKGSFYSHFRDGRRAEADAAVISQWLRDKVAALPDIAVGAVQDPVDRVRMIRAAAADSAVRDGVVRRWAAVSPGAAAAVAEADQIVASRLERALVNMGFAGRESAALASWLAAALQKQAIAQDPGGFDAVLAVLARAASITAIESVTADDAVVLFAGGGGLTGDERLLLQRLAQAITSGRDTAGPPQDPEQAQAGQA